MPEKNDPLLTILTVNYNTSDFIEVMLHGLRKLTANPYKVIICDNGSSDDHLLALVKLARDHENLEIFFRVQSAPGSIGHGEAMDLLVARVDTPYFVTMDSDATFLLPDWDQVLLARLNDTVKAIGTQASGGNRQKDFPCMFAVLYDTAAFLRSGASFLPNRQPQTVAGFMQDTGYEIRERFLQLGYRGEVIECFNTRSWKQGLFPDLLVAEFYLPDLPQAVVSHFARGSTSGRAKYTHGWRRLPLIGHLAVFLRGRRERRRWIARVRERIDQVARRADPA